MNWTLGWSARRLMGTAASGRRLEIMKVVRCTGVEIDMIGRVEVGQGVELHTRDGIKDFEPRFRESAYTPIKKAVDEGPVRDFVERIRGERMGSS